MSTSTSATEVPSHRSCASCRSHKVRCVPDDSNPSACQRCVRVGRDCVFTPVQRRKQRVRTDTRVAELEKEMRAMRAALRQKEEESARPSSPTGGNNGAANAPVASANPPGLWYKDSLPAAGSGLGQSTARPQQTHSNPAPVPVVQRQLLPAWPTTPVVRSVEDGKDVVDNGIVSMATARRLVDVYRDHLFPQYPLIALPVNITAEQLRDTKPTLFLAVIAAAACKDNSELSTTLDKEVLQAYAARSLVGSEKSLELVQALVISATWYNPPTKFGHLKYYEYMHMAAAMAMDIGIGSRASARRIRMHHRDVPAESSQEPRLPPRRLSTSWDVASIECRRTYLACYIICSGISFSMRRPNMLRTSNYIRECVDLLEQNAELPTDPAVVAWARLTMIGESISVALGYDDGAIESLADMRTQIMVKDFARQLSEWRNSLPAIPGGSASLLMMYHNIRLCLFELALHVEHSPEDFRAPYQMGVVQPTESMDADDVPTQTLAEGISECISSAHAAIDLFVAMDDDSIRSLPVFGFVRITGAAFVLAKLCLSAVQPQGRIGSILDRSSLKVEHYMDRLILCVRSVMAKQPTRIFGLVLALTFKLRQWCLDPSAMSRNFQNELETIASSSRAETLDPDEELERVAVIQLEGPRIEEQISSPELSPPQQHDSQQPHASNPQPLNPDHIASIPTTNLQQPTFPTFLNSQTPLHDASIPLNNHSSNAAYMQSLNAMNLDNDIFQMMGDMNAFAGGGLTGLEQWGDLPADLTGMGDMNWGMGEENGLNGHGGGY